MLSWHIIMEHMPLLLRALQLQLRRQPLRVPTQVQILVHKPVNYSLLNHMMVG